MVKSFYLHRMHKHEVSLPMYELFLKKRGLVNSMFKLNTEIMKVRLVSLNIAFWVTDDSKALQVSYNYSKTHSNVISVKWKYNPSGLVIFFFDLQQSSCLWLLATTKQQKNTVRQWKTNMNSLEDFLILLSYLLNHQENHILKTAVHDPLPSPLSWPSLKISKFD